MPSHDSASFGKRQEFLAIAELLKRDYDVYLTLVDDKQIDCVVRREVANVPVYLDIQIKARSKDCKLENAGRFAGLEIRNPRPNYFFLLYLEVANKYWIIPSKVVAARGSCNMTGDNEGRYTIVLAYVRPKTERVTLCDKFQEYIDNFDILTEWQG